MKRLLLILSLAASLAAEEIPASKVVKVDHREGFTVKTDGGHTASEALLLLKGAQKPVFGLVVEGGGTHYYTISRPNKDVLVGEGRDVKYELDQKANTFTVTRGGKRVVEKITTTVDS